MTLRRPEVGIVPQPLRSIRTVSERASSMLPSVETSIVTHGGSWPSQWPPLIFSSSPGQWSKPSATSAMTSAGVRPGSWDNRVAAAAATIGAEKLVPGPLNRS